MPREYQHVWSDELADLLYNYQKEYNCQCLNQCQ